MWNKFINSNFFQSWISVFGIIFRPGFFASAFVTCSSLYLSVFYKDNIPFSNTMAIVGSLSGGVASSGFLSQKCEKCNQLISPYSPSIRMNSNRCDNCQDSLFTSGSRLII